MVHGLRHRAFSARLCTGGAGSDAVVVRVYSCGHEHAPGGTQPRDDLGSSGRRETPSAIQIHP